MIIGEWSLVKFAKLLLRFGAMFVITLASSSIACFSVQINDKLHWHVVTTMSAFEYAHGHGNGPLHEFTCALEYSIGDSVAIVELCSHCREYEHLEAKSGMRYHLIGVHNANKSNIPDIALLIKQVDLYEGANLRNCSAEFVADYIRDVHSDLVALTIEQTKMGMHWSSLASSAKLTTIRLRATDDVPVLKLAVNLPHLSEVEITNSGIDLMSSDSEFINTSLIVYLDSQFVVDGDTERWSNLFQKTGIYIVAYPLQLPDAIFAISSDNLIIRTKEHTRVKQSRALHDFKVQCILGRQSFSEHESPGSFCSAIMKNDRAKHITVVSDQEVLVDDTFAIQGSLARRVIKYLTE
ncbi:MAG TPA: hypothetical protein PLW14_12880 [Chlorobiota bacterium]|nr:hypothetical protein [Chlorobiota bacterium]